ncbi:hypothetical protein BSKO_07619 [Bryopsis sp. KO-2023]|nr:hypothetical protein BSKO_07619 [Bryopsis sp. KO-2023]
MRAVLHVTFVLLLLCASANAANLAELLHASKTGNLEAIQQDFAFLESYSVSCLDRLTGGLLVQKRLVDAGVDVNAGDDPSSKLSPLMVAAEDGQQEAVKILIREGADVDVPTGVFARPLQEAAQYGREAAVQLLLNAGADVDEHDRFGNTALNKAAQFGQEAIVRILLRANADVNFTNRSRQSSIHFAAANGNINIIKDLINAGVDITARQAGESNPLHLAAQFGHFEAVKLLLEQGVFDIEQTKSGGQTALDLAAAVDTNNGRETVKLLREKGAKSDGLAAFLADKVAEDKFRASKALIEAGADVNYVNEFTKETPLHRASSMPSVQLVELLLDNGADPCLKDSDGKTAPDLYCSFGFVLEECLEENPKPANLECA